ncbi:hypothetical protein TNCV_2294311 [Trichonephila clavipes]|nr:hypothetical protein TNCV_2294311 [Trichonephila clavipes]
MKTFVNLTSFFVRLKECNRAPPSFGARQDGRVASPTEGHTVRVGTRIASTVCPKRSTRWKIGPPQEDVRDRGLNGGSSDKM